ncbi:Benzyl alcohol O-benzoyltransferase [Melia azedarach]|uniref:Benzyl alcohol O-benzoyltransferase n=1 Tax=Melia azedarach TaxID=155640 RepID=A0ACC1YLU1_MELAZ|nr:Benzyl alcohol O-benzoyltransferase [Melia azedarach]
MANCFPQVFSVTRKPHELIIPARSTPREMKNLSDIDDQESLRFHVPALYFYENNPEPSMKGKDPVKVIKEAVSRALVFYYPLAGRLREGPDRKLTVDCNAEGVLFIEAEANFKLEQLGNAIQPPCPYLDELLYNVPGSDGILGCPLLLIQVRIYLSKVTRLTCGGFIVGLRFNHTIWDGFGLMQFLKTIEEMARGEHSPSVFPVWQRELLNARSPPQITCIHHEYEVTNNNQVPEVFTTTNPNNMIHKSFYFGPKDIKSLRQQLPLYLRNCSTFELLAAFIWRCRTIALKLDPEETVRFSCPVNVRGKSYNMYLPTGYYGNAMAFPAVCSKAEVLCRNPLEYAVKLVKKAKAKVNEEYIRSVADLMVIKGRLAKFPTKANFIISDLTKVGLREVDLGWGKPVHGGVASAISFISFFLRYIKEDGESGTLIPILLPPSNMERFEEEMKRMNQESTMKDLCNNKKTQIFCKL